MSNNVEIILSAKDHASKVMGDFGSKMDGVKKKMDAFAAKASHLGNVMTVGLTVPLIGAGVAITKLASDQGEALNAASVVFGEAIDVIEAYGQTAAQTAGLTKTEFYQMGAELGAILKGFGIDVDEAAGHTVDLTARAADMASIFNTDVSQALAAIQSGLRGQSQPLTNFGVNLTEANIKAKALELGLWDGEGALTEYAKATARLAVIIEQTDDIAGDFANTSDDLANKTRIATAEAKNQAAELGQRLIPIALQLVTVLEKLTSMFAGLSEKQKDNVVTMGIVVAAAGPVIKILTGIYFVVGKLIPIFALLVKGFGAIVIAVKAVGVVLSAVAMPTLAALVAAIGLVIWAVDSVIFNIKQLGPVLKGEITYLEYMKAGFANLIKPIEWVTDKIKTFIDWVSKIKIPDVLLGKSPSPFEKSLRGITDAMDGLNKRQFMPGLVGAGAAASGAINNTYYTYNMTANYPHQNRASLAEDIRLMEMMKR
jgi:hypothetical protein